MPVHIAAVISVTLYKLRWSSFYATKYSNFSDWSLSIST